MKIGILIITALAIMGMVSTPEGRCPNCGLRFHGWALRNLRHQACPKCGRGLDIKSSDGTISKGYSPFDAEGYSLNPPGKDARTDEIEKSSHGKDKGSDVKGDDR